MIYLKWTALLPVDMLMKIAGLILAPFFSLSVSKNGQLPRLFRWFETPDSNMFGFLGDKGFYEEHRYDTDTFWGRWWVCTLWQWRNTSQGFSTYVIGASDENTRTVWQSGEGDLVKYFKLSDDAFELKGAAKWPFLKKRFRWRIGWKLQWDERFPAQYVFSICPFMSYEE